MRRNSDHRSRRLSCGAAHLSRPSRAAFLEEQVVRLFDGLAHLHGLPRSVLPLVQEAVRLFCTAGSIPAARARWHRRLGNGEEPVAGQSIDRRYILSFALGVMSASALSRPERPEVLRARVCVPAEIALRIAALLRLATGLAHPRGGGTALGAVADDGSALVLKVRSGPGAARALKLLQVRCDLWNAIMARPITAVAEVPRGQPLTTSLAELPVAQAAARILLRQLEIAASRRYGTDYLEDPEFIHEMRRAVRKALTASRLFRRLPGVNGRTLRAILKPLSRVLGQARDADVFLQFLHAWVNTFGTGPAVDRLCEQTQSHRQVLCGIVWRAVQDAESVFKLDTIMAQLRLVAGGNGQKPAAHSDPAHGVTLTAAAPALTVASCQAVLAFRRNLKHLPVGQVHALRCACRRLGYAADFFHDVAPQSYTRLRKATERVQRRLGKVHDLELYEKKITRLAAESVRTLPPTERAAFAVMRDAVRRERRHTRDAAARAWLRLRKRLRLETAAGNDATAEDDSRFLPAPACREAR